MHSVKPGRGPSLIGAIFALIFGVPFTLVWISQAARMRAPGFFILFGFVFLIAVLASALLGFYNATAKDRISQYDITTGTEESDPFDRIAPHPTPPNPNPTAASEIGSAKEFCPFCGQKLEREFAYCPKCGRQQPAGGQTG